MTNTKTTKILTLTITLLLIFNFLAALQIYADSTTTATEQIETTTYIITSVYHLQNEYESTYYITAVNPNNPLDVWQLKIFSYRYNKKLLKTLKKEFIGQYVEVTYFVGDSYILDDDEYINYTIIDYSILE